jgi:hypothetical protein
MVPHRQISSPNLLIVVNMPIQVTEAVMLEIRYNSQDLSLLIIQKATSAKGPLKRAYSDASAVTSAAQSVLRLPRKISPRDATLQFDFTRDLRGSARKRQKLPNDGRTGDRSLDLELL